jgi:RimJ/RimL family protein N-acetyltransferase
MNCEPVGISFYPSQEHFTQVTIQTERLLLKSISREEVKYFETLFGDPIVMKMYGTGDVKTVEYAQKRVNTLSARWENGDPFSCFSVWHKESKQFMGAVILGHGDNPGESEMAFLFHEEFWNQGYGRESISAIFEQFVPSIAGRDLEGAPFHLITASARIDNLASNAILKRWMTLERLEEKHGALRNIYTYSLPNEQTNKISRIANQAKAA